jgi:hypothetical protein
MKQRIDKTCFVVAMFVTLLGIAVPPASAGIAVSPMQQWVTVKPGQQASFTISVSNTIRDPQTPSQEVEVELVDFAITPEGGISFGKEFTHSRSAVKLINLENSGGRFVLEPGQSRQLKGVVSAPFNADGDYWAAVMIRILNPQKDARGVVVNLQTASGVFIHVPRRKYTERGSITNANITLPDFTQSSDPNQKADPSEKSAMQITAELKNDGAITFLGNGKAYLYTGKMKRFASIQMHTPRRQIFPTQSRIFTGVLSDALPAGTYKMRVMFEPAPQHSDSDTGARTIIKDFTFTVDPNLAQKWSQKSNSGRRQQLKFQPKELKLDVNAGRFTTVSVLVENIGFNTAAVKTHFDKTAVKDWFSCESELTTFGPNMKRNLVFTLSVPKDIQPGDYTGALVLEAERSRINSEDVTEKTTIPINIKVVK